MEVGALTARVARRCLHLPLLLLVRGSPGRCRCCLNAGNGVHQVLPHAERLHRVPRPERGLIRRRCLDPHPTPEGEGGQQWAGLAASAALQGVREQPCCQRAGSHGTAGAPRHPRGLDPPLSPEPHAAGGGHRGRHVPPATSLSFPSISASQAAPAVITTASASPVCSQRQRGLRKGTGPGLASPWSGTSAPRS